MSFVESFIILTADISDTQRGVYVNARVRAVQHPIETTEHLVARLLTYCHAYSENLEFTQGLYDLKLPTLTEKDSIGHDMRWIQVGLDDTKKLERSVRSHPASKHSVYFENEDQVSRFCHHLKGSKTNWVLPVEFYLWDPVFVNTLAEALPVRPTWQISFVDNAVYLDNGSQELSSIIEPVNIWERYQEALQNAEAALFSKKE